MNLTQQAIKQDFKPCIRDFYLRPAPAGDLDHIMAEDEILVLETDLPIEPGKPCEDTRLEDLLIALEPIVRYAEDQQHHIKAVEIKGRAARAFQAAMAELSKIPS